MTVLSNMTNIQTFLFDPPMGSKTVVPLQIEVDMAVRAMDTPHTAPELKPQYRMQFNVLTLLVGSYPFAENNVSIF